MVDKQEKCSRNSSRSHQQQHINSNYNLKSIIKSHVVKESDEKPDFRKAANMPSKIEKKTDIKRNLSISRIEQSEKLWEVEEKGKNKVFKWGERLGEEDIKTEYKNFNCTEIMKEQYKILTKGICAFLNTEGGKLYLGVDNSGRVIGRQFTESGKQKFENTLLKMISSFSPVPPENSIKLKFYHIIDTSTQQYLDNRYIVIIKAKKGPIGELFMDQDGKSYYRLDGCTQKYSQEEYQEELQLRIAQKASLDEYNQTQALMKQTEAEFEALLLNQYNKQEDFGSYADGFNAPDRVEEDENFVNPALMEKLEKQQSELSYDAKESAEENEDDWNSEMYGKSTGWNNASMNSNHSYNSYNSYAGYGGFGYGGHSSYNNYAQDMAYPTNQQALYAPRMYPPQEQQQQQQMIYPQQEQVMYPQNQFYYAPSLYMSTYNNTQPQQQQYFDPQPQFQYPQQEPQQSKSQAKPPAKQEEEIPQYQQSGGFYSDKELEDYIKMINQAYEQQPIEKDGKSKK